MNLHASKKCLSQKCHQLYRSWIQRQIKFLLLAERIDFTCFTFLAEKISRLNSVPFFFFFLLFTIKNKLLKGFSARWKIVRINLLMADSLEGINRLRKSCSTHAKNCGRISEIVSRLAPRAREIIDSILSERAHKMAGARLDVKRG